MIKFISEIKSVIDNNQPLKEAIIFATDTKELFVDIDNKRIQINDINIVDTVSSLDNILAPLSNKLYFVEENNLLYKYKNNKWIGITTTQEQYKALNDTVDDLIDKYKNLTTEVNTDYILSVSNWNNNKYIIHDELFNNDSTIRLSAPKLDLLHFIALSSAKIIVDDSDIVNNNIILEATGVIPTTDIPIQISVFLSSDGSTLIVDDLLTSTSRINGLSANQGRVLNNLIGDLSNLNTSEKSSLVNAINELFVVCG